MCKTLQDEDSRKKYDLQLELQFQQWLQQQQQQPSYFPRGDYRKYTIIHNTKRATMPNKVSRGRQPTSPGQAWRWTQNNGHTSNVTSSKNQDAASSAEMQRRRRGNTNTNTIDNWRSATSTVNNVNTPGQRHDVHEGSHADRTQP